jgi:hypothetical protein
LRVSTILNRVNRLPGLFCTVLLGFSCFVPVVLWSQQESETGGPAKTAASEENFSGTVTKLTPDSVTVVRKLPGHDAVTREFMRDEETRVEGKLRERARVTVRYRAAEDGGFAAVYIIVR